MINETLVSFRQPLNGSFRNKKYPKFLLCNIVTLFATIMIIKVMRRWAFAIMTLFNKTTPSIRIMRSHVIFRRINRKSNLRLQSLIQLGFKSSWLFLPNVTCFTTKPWSLTSSLLSFRISWIDYIRASIFFSFSKKLASWIFDAQNIFLMQNFSLNHFQPYFHAS